nr:nolF [Sinorhizobium meliloti]prf//1718309B nolF gene [Sinorhizobium meliloti]
MTISAQCNVQKLAFATTLAVTIVLSQGRAIGQVKHGSPIELAEADVSTAVRQDMANEVRIVGSLTPIRRSTLTSRVSRRLLTSCSDRGRGQCRRSPRPFRKGSSRIGGDGAKSRGGCLSAQTELAEAVLERNTRLGERGAASEATRLAALADVLDLRAHVRSKQAEVSDAERSLSHAEVRAEFGGVIRARSVEEGQTVPLNTQLMTIVELNRLEVDAGVPTSRIPLIRLKQSVELMVEGFPGRTFSGEVARISPTADAGSRAVRVFIAVDNEEGLLRGGMFTIGDLRVDDQKDVIALPATSIRHDARWFFRSEGGSGRFAKTTCRARHGSWSDRDLVQVSGVSEGDVIVTAPLPDLVANTPVYYEGI